METHGSESSGRPTPEEAGAALRAAEQAQSSLTGIPPPWWYFTALAVMLAVLPVINFAPSTPLGITLTLAGIVVWAALLGITIGMYMRKVGVVPRLSAASARMVLPPTVGALAVMIGAAVLAGVYDQDWIWFVASGALACLVLIMGTLIRRHARKMA
jgi:hypothetical protein